MIESFIAGLLCFQTFRGLDAADRRRARPGACKNRDSNE
jgi:hypothetical protein